MTGIITTRDDAVAFLDARIGGGVKPGLERISGLLALMGDPHREVPIIHVAGTNGKSTTVRLIAGLLEAHGLGTGTFTSPHLQRLEERFTVRGRVLDDAELVAAVADVAPFVEEHERRDETALTYFEVTTAMAFSVFSTAGVDVAVVEVGLGGRWDATNVVDADVSVITGIAIDHTSWLGHSIADIAGEKAAILKPAGRLVSGALPAAAEGPITAQVSQMGASWFRGAADFGVDEARRAMGGWVGDIRGVHETYDEVFLPLHGRHQLDHLATAVAAVEVFFGRALAPEAVREAAAAATSPGRLEVITRRPLVIVDGAHNAQGIEGLATTLANEFPEAHRILVVGFRGERDPVELLTPLRGLVGEVIATAAGDPEAVPADSVAAAAREVFGPDTPVDVVTPVAEAAVEAVDRAGEDDAVVVTGSLYVVGEARTRLLPGSG